MTTKEAIQKLEAYNSWMNGHGQSAMPGPKEIVAAIQFAAEALRQMQKLEAVYNGIDPEGWITHEPGDRLPVEENEKVEVRLRNGETLSAFPAYFWGLPGGFFSMWERLPEDHDAEIVAWRRPR